MDGESDPSAGTKVMTDKQITLLYLAFLVVTIILNGLSLYWNIQTQRMLHEIMK